MIPAATPGNSRAERPELEVELLVPDLHDELRWPLGAMSHPELEPQFSIASVFAETSVGWIELCERGVQNRVTSGRYRDELDYLRGWCGAIKGDADKACEKLTPLLRSTVAGLGAAVRTDLANIIASAGDVDVADRLIAKHRIDDVEILDLLAATYVELGKERDAYEINRRAMDSVAPATNEARCQRIVKDMLLGGQAQRLAGREELTRLAKDTQDPTCMKLSAASTCSQGAASDCEEYFKLANIDTRYTHLLAAYRRWPASWQSVDAWAWFTIGDLAFKAMPLPGAEKVMHVAYHAALDAKPPCFAAFSASLAVASALSPDPRFAAELARCPAPPALPGALIRIGALAAEVYVAGIATVERLAAAVVSYTSCSAAGPKNMGLNSVKHGDHAAALAHFETSLQCNDDPYVRTLAFFESCASGNAARAKHHYKGLTPAQQTKFAQICIRQKPPVAYE